MENTELKDKLILYPGVILQRKSNDSLKDANIKKRKKIRFSKAALHIIRIL